MYNETDRYQTEIENAQAADRFIQNPESKTLREQIAEMNAMNLPDYQRAACLDEINENAFYGRCVDDPEEIDRLFRDVKRLNRKGGKIIKRFQAAMFRLKWGTVKNVAGKDKVG
jgi:hypothetical protein